MRVFSEFAPAQEFISLGVMALSVGYYFMLPIGAAYFQDVFRIRVWGVLNIGLLFALSLICGRLRNRADLLAQGEPALRSAGRTDSGAERGGQVQEGSGRPRHE
jgi:Protein of unknown function, DUF485